jgi:hypothetical protein
MEIVAIIYAELVSVRHRIPRRNALMFTSKLLVKPG